MSLKCRVCLTDEEKNCFSLLAVFPGFGTNSILDLLNIVTSSQVIYSDSLPCKICVTCFNNLKSAYNFIIQFKNSEEVLRKNAQMISQRNNSVNQQKTLKTNTVVKNEENLNQILNSKDTDRIVIINDDGSTCEDVVQEIFGDDEKQDSQKKEIKSMNSSNRERTLHNKIVLVSVDDVLQQRLSSKYSNENISKCTDDDDDTVFRQTQKDEISSDEKDENTSIKGDVSTKDENEAYFIEENEYYTTDSNEEGNNFSETREEATYSNENSEEDEDLKIDLLQMEKNRDRNINNIQIVTIDDVINMEKSKKGDKKTILSIEDVLNVKSRPKKRTTSNDSGLCKCTICDSTFEGHRKLKLHKLRNHNPNWQEKFKCHICGEQCKTMSAHRHHLTKHGTKRFPCNQCEKSYISRSKMKEHILRVHEKKLDNKYLCTECGKGFKFSNALEYHMNKHTNSRNFMCRYCGFACMASSALKRHERTHTGERPYECKHCKKTFAGAAEKQKHEFGHEGVFRFKCKYCSKPFIQTYNMKVHWMRHKGPYACEVCEKNFADAEILQFHYAHSHKIKNVIIEDADVKSDDEMKVELT